MAIFTHTHLQERRSGATLNDKYDNVCTIQVPYDMNTIYQPKNLESVTHITENELTIYMLSTLLSDSHSTEMLSDVLGALPLKKNDLF